MRPSIFDAELLVVQKQQARASYVSVVVSAINVSNLLYRDRLSTT